MHKYTKVFFILYFIVIGVIIFTSEDLSVLATKLSYVQCGSANGIPKPIPQLTTICYTLLIVGAPLVLIIFSIISLVKAVMGGNADEISKARTKLFKKFIACALVFVTASIVQFLLLNIASNAADKNSITSCMKCFLYNECSTSTSGNDIRD